jgi:hypothetical protein
MPPSTVASPNPAQLARVPIPWLRSGQFHRSRDGPSPAVAGAKRVAGAGDPRQGRSGKKQRLLRRTHLVRFLALNFLILGLDACAAGVSVVRSIPIRVTRMGYDGACLAGTGGYDIA